MFGKKDPAIYVAGSFIFIFHHNGILMMAANHIKNG